MAALAVTGRARLYVPFGPMIAVSALAVAVRPEWFLRAAGAVWDWWKLTWTI